MNIKAKTIEPDDIWDEREVGADDQYVEVASDISKELDAALDLHPISIRLQKSLVDNLKALAHLHGLGYQPLVRQILTRWVESELKQMLAQRANATAKKMHVDTEPAASSAGKRGARELAAKQKKAA